MTFKTRRIIAISSFPLTRGNSNPRAEGHSANTNCNQRSFVFAKTGNEQTPNRGWLVDSSVFVYRVVDSKSQPSNQQQNRAHTETSREPAKKVRTCSTFWSQQEVTQRLPPHFDVEFQKLVRRSHLTNSLVVFQIHVLLASLRQTRMRKKRDRGMHVIESPGPYQSLLLMVVGCRENIQYRCTDTSGSAIVSSYPYSIHGAHHGLQNTAFMSHSEPIPSVLRVALNSHLNGLPLNQRVRQYDNADNEHAEDQRKTLRGSYTRLTHAHTYRSQSRFIHTHSYTYTHK